MITATAVAGPPHCPADVDESGAVDFADILALINAWGPCPSAPGACPADIDDDGLVGFSDLVIVLTQWGSCGPTIAEQITIELLRPNDDPIGRPLPIAAHWNTGRTSSPRTGWDAGLFVFISEARHLDRGGS